VTSHLAAPVGLTHRTAPRGAISTAATPAIEHHEPVTMPGARHARLLRKRFDDSLDDLVLVDSVVFMYDVGVVTT
jgi:hypothetical protein